MTSRLPSSTRIWSEVPLPAEMPTLAHVMSLAGYDTALIGRMHFVGADQRHGFLERPIGEFTAKYPGSVSQGGKPWQHYPGATAGQFREGLNHTGHGTTFYQYLDEQVTDTAVSYLASRGRASTARANPFFALVGYVLPHCPYIAPKELFDYYYDRVPAPDRPERLPRSTERFREIRGLSDEPPTEHQVRSARAAYYALVELLDAHIGRVLDAIEESGQADRTMVIYVSDHGDMIGSHDCWWKSLYYEGSVRVPLIMSGPAVGEGAGGSVSGQLASLMDIGPTLFEIAGAKTVHAHDGMSLLGCLRSPEQPGDADRVLVSEMVDVRRDEPPIASRMVRRGHWKIWQTWEQGVYSPPALFDLAHDPEELNDVGRSLRCWPTRQRMLKLLRTGWDPSDACASAMRGRRDLFDVIQPFGKRFVPASEDALPYPDPELESDFTPV